MCFNAHEWRFPKLPRASLQWVNRMVSDQEIKVSIFQLGASKEPDPDGLPAVFFFQKHWHWVGDMVTKFIKEVFTSGIVPESMNRSLISLIPKQAHFETIAQFQPICLCNVVIKVISKVIANRMKLVIGSWLCRNKQALFWGDKRLITS